jgi:hypothetical protein
MSRAQPAQAIDEDQRPLTKQNEFRKRFFLRVALDWFWVIGLKDLRVGLIWVLHIQTSKHQALIPLMNHNLPFQIFRFFGPYKILCSGELVILAERRGQFQLQPLFAFC